MNIFRIVVAICVCLMITLGAVFSTSMFSNIDSEAGIEVAGDAYASHGQVTSWIYVIAFLLILLTIYASFVLAKEQAQA